MDTGIDPQLVVDMVQKRAWLPLGALAVGIGIRLLKSDIRIFPDVPPRWRIWACFGLGQVAGGIEAVIAGKTYREAIVWGITQSVMAILGQNAIIDSLRGGKEIPVPGLTVPGIAPSPGKPPSIPPAAGQAAAPATGEAPTIVVEGQKDPATTAGLKEKKEETIANSKDII